MLATLLFVFLFWLPLATLLHAIVRATGLQTFAHWWKHALYVTVASPALLANWLVAVAARNQTTVERLEKVGDWFKS